MIASSVLIVGASLAGHATARALRGQGFDGTITMIGDEPHRPYDRPPLSKEFLAGTMLQSDLALEADDESLDSEWILGVRATAFDADARQVTLADGRTFSADAVVLATGSRAKTLGDPLRGVHTLRTLDDAIALRTELVPGARLVVVGAGFIGLEVAATARRLGAEVTVVGSAAFPLSGAFGPDVGAALRGLHERGGTRVYGDVRATAVEGTDAATGVRLNTGELLPADVVLIGIGSVPATEWLRNSGLDVSDGVVCDAVGGTGVDGVFAVGDCSAWFDSVRGTAHRVEHWQDSRDRPVAVATAILTGTAPDPSLRPTYLWSDQWGVRLQFAGRLRGDEVATIEAGSVEGADLLVLYRRGGAEVAALGLNQPRAMMRWRKTHSDPPSVTTTLETAKS
ncbi:MAG: NAD(P)H-nitrite reductase [Glaciihabitans sp.]|nr:NAD(P)H-nitrite reductase [Glaciihabitans sp.]